MGALIDWLVQDEQSDLFEAVVGLALNLLYLGLVALALWPLGLLGLVGKLAKGFGVLWVVTVAVSAALTFVQRSFRINLYDRTNLFIASNLAVGCGLQVAWAANAAHAVQGALPGPSLWLAAALYVVGGLACLVAFYVVAAFYQGAIYKLISMPLALASYVLFCAWPAGAAALGSWF